jgi:flagellar hook-associated protein 1 FlgK
MPDLLNVATSGLLGMQKALATTGHNIANVDTEGYSRQVLTFESREPELGARWVCRQRCARIYSRAAV